MHVFKIKLSGKSHIMDEPNIILEDEYLFNQIRI